MARSEPAIESIEKPADREGYEHRHPDDSDQRYKVGKRIAGHLREDYRRGVGRSRTRDARGSRTIDGRKEWIEGTLELAATLAEARARFPNDQKFSVWLSENGLDVLGANDRAALITMSGNIEMLRVILEEQTEHVAHLPHGLGCVLGLRGSKVRSPPVGGPLCGLPGTS
jgi:hypothetical protein